MALVKSMETKAKEEAENDDEMTAQICEALISFSNVNTPPKANGSPKKNIMDSEMILRAIVRNNETSDLS